MASLTTALPNKAVVAHFMMGLTYNYAQSDFQNDIQNAISLGLDGFVLNFGNDSWMMSKLTLMYNAADALNLQFLLYLNLDMSEMSTVPASTLVNYVQTFANRGHQARINNNVVVGTFLGQDINFGQSSVNQGWQVAFKNALASAGINIFFMPTWPLDASTIYQTYPVADGFCKWNCWPYYTSSPTSDAEDLVYIQNSKATNKKYMATVSPIFYTHFTSKNYSFFSEGLWFTRWMQLIKDQPDYVQVLTWNDYGESTYIGPTNYAADFPVIGSNSHEWVDSFTHAPLSYSLPLFIQMYKQNTTGLPSNFSGISQLYVTYRVHSKNATASSDSIPRPDNYQNSSDVISVISFAKSSYTLRVSVNGTVLGTTNVNAGVQSANVSFIVNNTAAAGLPLFQILNGTTVIAQGYGPLNILGNNSVVLYNFNFCTTRISW
ncbi:Glucan endo-1,3-alpha-glucosidase agn2 [Schizosaccharomyces pombe]